MASCSRLIVSLLTLFGLLDLIVSISGTTVEYSTVPGYFLQDLNSTNATTFNYTATNFGLINQTYPNSPPNANSLTQWQQFANHLRALKATAPATVSYKLVWFARHGEGTHNAAETYYGTPAWNCYWSLLNGNATSVWADAHLTPAGSSQAQIAHTFWQQEIPTQNIPTPDVFYVSPLWRCLQTAKQTFDGLVLSQPGHDHHDRHQPVFTPIIKEKLREGVSLHTCDRRSDRQAIAAGFPDFKFEAGFLEKDPLWNGVRAETSNAQDQRSREVLDDIFTSDGPGKCATYISVTSHSGEIASLLRVLGHRPFGLSTGAVIPVLIKIETVLNKTPTATTSAATWSVSPHCTAPPVTSISGAPSGGCVCAGGAAVVTTTLI